MKKNIVKEEIFRKHFDGQLATVRFSDLPKDIQENDIIDIERVEGFYSENNSWDEHTNLVVYRQREETDEEFQKRNDKLKTLFEESKKRRYESYLKLKKEFEG